tara:strand:- start:12236 stop:15478 length:3243 start_codon:yes stop_codon:yes gene_type:complete
MATTTFTNATDYGPDDSINSVVNINGITAGNVTNVRFEIDWNPNGADPFCGGDASSSSCTVTDPDGGVVNMFSSYTKSGANARTDTHDITSGFASTFNGNYTFTLEDEDAMGCNTVTETRIIVTYTESVANAPTVGATTTVAMANTVGTTINKPASTAEGDLLLLVVQTHLTTRVLNPIDGFNYIYERNANNTTGGHYTHILYKIATDSEPSSYSLSWTSGSDMLGASLTRVSSVDTVCPIGPIGFKPFISSSTNSHKGVGIPAADGDCVVFRIASVSDNISSQATADSGLTEVYNDDNSSGSDNTLLVGYDTSAYAGTADIPEKGWTTTNSDNSSTWTIVIYGANNQSGRTLSVPKVRSVETQGNYTNPSDAFIEKPSGTQPGDLLMAFIAEGGSSSLEFDSPFGNENFTTLQSGTLYSSQYFIAYKIATATEPDYYRLNQSDGKGGIIRITDYDPTNIFGTYGLTSGVREGSASLSTPPQSGYFPIASGLDSDSLFIKGIFFSENDVLGGGLSSFTPSGVVNGAHNAGVLFEENSSDGNDYTVGVYQEAGGSGNSRDSYWATVGYGATDSHMAFALGINSGAGSGVPSQSSGTVVPVVHATVTKEIDATVGTSSPVSINKPADTAEGDLLLATAVGNNDTARDFFNANGFNFFLTSPSSGDSTTSRQTYLAYKIATGSEPSSYDFNFSPVDTPKYGLSLTRVSNVDTLCPIGALRIYEESTDTIHRSPPIEIDGDSLVFRLSSVEDNGTYYPDTSITELVNNNTTTTSDTAHLFGYDTVSYGSGTTAIGRGWSGSSDLSLNVSFVVYGSGQSNRVASGPILHSVSEFDFVSSTNASEEIDKPAGTTEGDLLVFFAVNPNAGNDGDNPKLTDESFTPVSSGALRSSYSDYLIAYKIATASEPSTYTLFPESAAGALCRISNFDSSDPIDFASSHLLRSDYGMDSGVYPAVTAGSDNPLVLRGIMYSNATPMASLQFPFMADSGTYPTLIRNAETSISNDAQINVYREAGGERNVREGVGWHNDGAGLLSTDYMLPFTMAINSAPATSNNVRFGSTTITKAYLGSQQLSKIRLGEQVIDL